MAYLCCRPGLTQETNPRRIITQISLADDLQCHYAVQIDVERLVSDPHRATAQLERFPVFPFHQVIVFKSLRYLFRCRLDRLLQIRLTGLNPASKTHAEHAYWTEFHRSRKLVAAARAGAFGLHFHGPTRPSAAI